MTSFQYIGSLRFATVLCLLSLPDQSIGVEGDYNVVDRSEVLEAMRQHYGDYELTAATHGAWLAEVVFYLVRQARERDPDGPPLFIGHEEWFRSFLEVTGQTEHTAPRYALLNYRYEQNMEVDYRLDRVIREVVEGPMPKLAVNVRVRWKDGPGRPGRYSYIDTLSTPNVRVTNHQVITYRLLDFGDWVVYDEIEGITARPESGVLALLLQLIGEGHMTHSRIAIAQDGIQVSWTRAEKAYMKVRDYRYGCAGRPTRSAGTGRAAQAADGN
ncbi:MAG: hypothetical protein J4F35_07560 [Candidatus Latescibacteria bacterium]|nr:hypothetical protein [Candidatus Latescibacterota bacterium]